MSSTLRPELQAKLRERATEAGIPVEAYTERLASRRSGRRSGSPAPPLASLDRGAGIPHKEVLRELV
jgi:hypothetical protein